VCHVIEQDEPDDIDPQAVHADDLMLDRIHLHASPDLLEQLLHLWARTGREGT
jgi:hypothetical protein